MLKISGLVGAAAFVCAFLLAGANSGLSIDTARADDCLAAPKAAAPAGQHWYYHFNRATRRRCWYLHAAVQLHHRAMIRHHAAAAAAAKAEPSPEPQAVAPPAAAVEWPSPSSAGLAAAPETPAQTATAPAPDTADAPPAPHVTVLAVRPATPFVSTTAAPQQSTSEKPPTTPTSHTPPDLNDAAAISGGKPADPSDAISPQGKAVAVSNAPPQMTDAATTDARTRTAEMFILLALVFGAAAALVAIMSKILGVYRRPRISDHPDAAWLSYRSIRQRVGAEPGSDEHDVPFLDPQEHLGLSDLHAQEWLDRSAPAQDGSSASALRNQDFMDPQPPQPSQTDIEPALRALRQARQSRVA